MDDALFGFGCLFESPLGDFLDCAARGGAVIGVTDVASGDAADMPLARMGFGLVEVVVVPSAGKSVVESNAGVAAGRAIALSMGPCAGPLPCFVFRSIFVPTISPMENDL